MKLWLAVSASIWACHPIDDGRHTDVTVNYTSDTPAGRGCRRPTTEPNMDADLIRQLDDPLYQILRNENVEAFNRARAEAGELPSFARCDFRGLDLRGLAATGLDFRDAYFRGADLRGIDFSGSRLDGASIAGAKISGCYFPRELQADEIVMSLNHGTRMRYNTGQ